jgi:hypothetical protein
MVELALGLWQKLSADSKGDKMENKSWGINGECKAGKEKTVSTINELFMLIKEYSDKSFYLGVLLCQ